MKITETIGYGRAKATIAQYRQKRDVNGNPIPIRYLAPEVIDPESAELVGEIEEVHNVVTDSGRDFLHAQGYSTGPGANGLNYIGLSNDALTETTASTTLSNEIAANGLTRAAGAYAHTNGTNTSTVTKTFTCATANQSAQKAALFVGAGAVTMNHALAFTQRNLIVGDTLQVQFTITLG